MIVKREYNVWLITSIGDTYIALGEIVVGLSLTTKHEVMEFETEQEYLDKCEELGIELKEDTNE